MVCDDARADHDKRQAQRHAVKPFLGRFDP